MKLYEQIEKLLNELYPKDNWVEQDFTTDYVGFWNDNMEFIKYGYNFNEEDCDNNFIYTIEKPITKEIMTLFQQYITENWQKTEEEV